MSLLSYKNSPKPTPEQQESIDYLTSLLGKPLCLTLDDRRTLYGYFAAVDKQQNIVLSEAEIVDAPVPTMADRPAEHSVDDWQVHIDRLQEQAESVRLYWPKSEPSGGPGTGWGGKEMGLVLVKGEQVVKVELLTGDDAASRRPVDDNPYAGMGIL